MADASLVDKVIIDQLFVGTDSLGFSNSYRNNIKALITDGDFLPLSKVAQVFLPFRNGLLCPRTKTLHPTAPDTAQTWCLPYDYTTGADCKNIKAWLLKAVDNDVETVEFLRAWLAALLHGRADLQKFLHIIGSGGTGKGTFMRVATKLIGEHNAVTTSLKEMETNKFETANFYGKRLVKITDSNKYGDSIDTLKAMTGQDHLRLERKHQQQSGGFIFGGLVILASNENLATTDHTSGLERRRLTVTFDRRATDAEKQAWCALGGEDAVLYSEMPGLVNWLLELSQDDISRIIRNPPERTKAANLEAMKAGNPLAEWFLERCIDDPFAWTQVGVKVEIKGQYVETQYRDSDKYLYPNYLQWAQQHNRAPVSIRRFREITIDAIKTLGFDALETRRNVGQGMQGVRLKTAVELSSVGIDGVGVLDSDACKSPASRAVSKSVGSDVIFENLLHSEKHKPDPLGSVAFNDVERF